MPTAITKTAESNRAISVVLDSERIKNLRNKLVLNVGKSQGGN